MLNSINTAELVIRKATKDDLPVIVQLLADDFLGQNRETFVLPLKPSYYHAFEVIQKSQATELLVAEYQGKVIGTAQVDYLTYLTYEGGSRAQIEGVRVDKEYRSFGIGKKLISAIINRAKEKGCHMVQLTMNKKRQTTIRFYEKLGFVSSHEGMKLSLLDEEN